MDLTQSLPQIGQEAARGSRRIFRMGRHSGRQFEHQSRIVEDFYGLCCQVRVISAVPWLTDGIRVDP
jgi:hypothetical protein